MRTPDLFEDTPPCEREPATRIDHPHEGRGPNRVAEVQILGAASDSDWQEVPQARFLSWTDREQWRYCAARDYDAAEHADTAAEAERYLARARMYEEMYVS